MFDAFVLNGARYELFASRVELVLVSLLLAVDCLPSGTLIECFSAAVLSFFALEVPLPPLDFCSSIFLIVDLGCRGFSLLGDFRLLFKLCIASIVDGSCPSLVVLVVVVVELVAVFAATASLSFAADDSPTTTDELVGDRSLHSSCFLYSSSRVQKPPLPGSSF